MRPAGLVTAGLAMTEPLCVSRLWGETVATRSLIILTLELTDRGPRLPGVVGYFVYLVFAAFLWACFISFIGAVVAVGRTIRPSVKTAA
jgi:hypothetical protein